MKTRLVILLSIFIVLLGYFSFFSLRSPFKNALYPIVYQKEAREILPDPKPSPNTHQIILMSGSNINGEILTRDEEKIIVREHLTQGSFKDHTINRQDVFDLTVNAQTFPVGASEIIARRLFPNMTFARYENYTVFTSGGQSLSGPVAGTLKQLYKNIKNTFPEIVTFKEKKNRICAVVFSESDDYKNFIQTINPNFVDSIGVYSSTHDILFVNYSYDVRRKTEYPDDTIRHEGAHQIFYTSKLHFGYNIDRLWLVEGLATYAETARLGEKSARRISTVQMQKNKFFALENFLIMKSVKNDDIKTFYTQVWAFTQFLMSEYKEPFLDYLLYVKKHPFLSLFKGDVKLLERFIQKDIKTIEIEFYRFWQQ